MSARQSLAVLALLYGVTLASPASAQNSGLAFLEIGVNAEAAAMGDAHVTSASNAFSVFWNPAGLASQSSNSAALAHHIWVADDRSYAGAIRLGSGNKSGFGIFVLANAIDEIEQRDRPGPPTGSFSAQYLTTGVGYGRTFGPVRLGAAVKFVSEKVLEVSARGYAVDFGTQVELAQKSAVVGLSVSNLGSMDELSTVETTLPTTIRGGVSVYPFRMIMEDDTRLVNSTLAIDVSYNEPAGQTRLHIGAGAEVVEMLTLRVGYITNDSLRGLTAGLGLAINELRFDYAVIPFENGFGGPGHIMSLMYTW